VIKFKVNWTTAKNFCEERGLELAKIESEREMKLVSDARPVKCECFGAREKWHYKMRLISDWYWVGASDFGRRPGLFCWTDGTQVDEALWNSGQPNDHGQGKETCVNLRHAKLYDYSCSSSRYFVCEVGEKFAKCL
jgi:hypothetical protein